MTFFLKLKHWQLFGLLFCTFCAFQISGASTTVISLKDRTFTITEISPLVILFISCVIGWYYSIGIILNKKIPASVKMQVTKFKWFLLLPVISTIFYYSFLRFELFNSIYNGISSSLILVTISILLLFFSIFCLFYCIYFNSKTIKTIELQRYVNFSDFVNEFVLLFLFPIGIWIIQPRINKMIK